MIKKYQSFILFTLGLLFGILFYWLAGMAFSNRAENKADKNQRIIASYSLSTIARKCPQLKTINDKENINIYCSFSTRKQDKGVTYKVRTKITIKTDPKTKKAVISVNSALRDQTEHITEADHCGDCSESAIIDVVSIDELTEVSNALSTGLSNILSQEEDRIEEAVEDAFDTYNKKAELKQKIANCEVSKRSTISYKRKITPEEKIECRKEQLGDITNPKDRTRFFHSKVKRDLWQLASQEDPLERSFFLSDYMQELNRPDFFTHDYFSVRSALDTVEKYSELRRHLDELGDNKLSALNNIKSQLPVYFYTNDKTATGRQDRRFLESAWNKNFSESPFPSYYSVSSSNGRSQRRTRGNGISANQFRAIVNSQEFKRLYQ